MQKKTFLTIARPMVHEMTHVTAHEMVHATVHEMVHETVHETALLTRLGMAQVSAHETALLTRPSSNLEIRPSAMMPMSSAMWTGRGKVL